MPPQIPLMRGRGEQLGCPGATAIFAFGYAHGALPPDWRHEGQRDGASGEDAENDPKGLSEGEGAADALTRHRADLLDKGMGQPAPRENVYQLDDVELTLLLAADQQLVCSAFRRPSSP
jgi:hypothetical protein